MRKRVIKLWGPWSSKKMEVWLDKKETDDWTLVDVYFFQMIFVFKKNQEAVNYQYSIDFQMGVNNEYRMICEDDGWELLSVFAGWYIWRRESDSCLCKLYTDIESIVEANKRIIMYLLFILAMQFMPIQLFMRNDIPLIIWCVYLGILFILVYSCIRLVIFNLTMKREKGNG